MELILLNGYKVQNLTQENCSILNFLVTCNEQADNFTFNYLLISSNENLAVGNYRVDRIEERMLDKDKFILLYNLNGKTALEELFMCPISEQEFLLLTNKMNNGKITINQLFDKHRQSPRARLLRLIAS